MDGMSRSPHTLPNSGVVLDRWAHTVDSVIRQMSFSVAWVAAVQSSCAQLFRPRLVLFTRQLYRRVRRPPARGGEVDRPHEREDQICFGWTNRRELDLGPNLGGV